MTNNDDQLSFDVPSLDILYQDEIIQKVDAIYYSNKKKYIKEFPIIEDYPQEMIPIYIVYFAIYLNVLDNSEDQSLKYYESLKDDIFLAKEVGKTISKLAEYLSIVDIEEEDYKEEYENYKEASRNRIYKKDPKVLSFMNNVYNPNVRNSAYGYIISEKCPSFDKIDLDLNTEQTIDACVYVFYYYLYYYYVNFCHNNPFFQYKFKKAIKNASVDSINELTSVYLKNLDDDLFNYEEFVEFLQKRQSAIMQIIVFAHAQFDEYESTTRTRNDK